MNLETKTAYDYARDVQVWSEAQIAGKVEKINDSKIQTAKKIEEKCKLFSKGKREIKYKIIRKRLGSS